LIQGRDALEADPERNSQEVAKRKKKQVMIKIT